MGDITLSASVRSNLNSLQNASKLIGGVQEKLATGKKVNSALDDPGAFFTAASLESRASDLGGLLSDIGQSVQVLKAADEGISSISNLVDSAKATATQALKTGNQAERQQFAKDLNDLLSQIEGTAEDAGYNGKNLLSGAGNDLSVSFNEDGSNKLDVSAVDYTDASSADGLNVSSLEEGSAETGTITLTGLTGGDTVVSDAQFEAGDVLTFTDGNGTELGSLEIDENTTVDNLADKLNGFKGVSASVGTGTIDITTEADLNIDSDGSGYTDSTIDATDSGFATDAAINSTIDKLNTALGTLRSQAATFGTKLSVVENRQDFTQAIINTLEEGAGKLTLADSNREGANLLTLQTRQTLASTALSISAQAEQNVLRLL